MTEENDSIHESTEFASEPKGSTIGRKLKAVLLYGLPALLLSTTFVVMSGKWSNDFRNHVASDITIQPPPAESMAPAEIELLKERVANTIRRDVTEKLKATEILEVRVESLEANPDGSMDLEFSASYMLQAEPNRAPASRAVTSKLKLEKKGPDWHVTSVSPVDSTLIIEDEALVETARKSAGK